MENVEDPVLCRNVETGRKGRFRPMIDSPAAAEPVTATSPYAAITGSSRPSPGQFLANMSAVTGLLNR